MFGPQSAKWLRVDHVGRELVAGRDQLQHHAAERAQHVLGDLHLMLDRHLAHQHDQAARRIVERAARGAGVALRAGPDLLLHGIVDALEVLRPQQLHDLARREVVVVRRRAGGGADAAVEAAVQLVVEAHVRLQVVEDRLELGARHRRRLGDGIADEVLDAGGGGGGHVPRDTTPAAPVRKRASTASVCRIFCTKPVSTLVENALERFPPGLVR